MGLDGQLSKVDMKCELVQQTTLRRVRIVGYNVKKWYVDPSLESIANNWKLWVLAGHQRGVKRNVDSSNY